MELLVGSEEEQRSPKNPTQQFDSDTEKQKDLVLSLNHYVIKENQVEEPWISAQQSNEVPIVMMGSKEDRMTGLNHSL